MADTPEASNSPAAPENPADSSDPPPEHPVEGAAAPAPTVPSEVLPPATVALLGPLPFPVLAVAQALLDAGHAVRILCASDADAQRVRGLKGEAATAVVGEPGDADALDRVLDGARAAAFLDPVTPYGRLWKARAGKHLDDLKSLIARAEAGSVRDLVYLSSVAADAKSLAPCLREAAEAETTIAGSRLMDYVLRAGPLVGSGDGFVERMVAQALNGSPLTVVRGYGDLALQPLHAADLGRCVARCVSKLPQELRTGVYAVAGEETLTELELLDRVLARLKRFKLKLHLPLFVARIQANAGGPESPAAERSGLLAAVFATERNDVKRLLGPGVKLTALEAAIGELSGAGAAAPAAASGASS